MHPDLDLFQPPEPALLTGSVIEQSADLQAADAVILPSSPIAPPEMAQSEFSETERHPSIATSSKIEAMGGIDSFRKTLVPAEASTRKNKKKLYKQLKQNRFEKNAAFALDQELFESEQIADIVIPPDLAVREPAWPEPVDPRVRQQISTTEATDLEPSVTTETSIMGAEIEASRWPEATEVAEVLTPKLDSQSETIAEAVIDGWLRQAEALISQGRDEEAVALYKQALVQEPTNRKIQDALTLLSDYVEGRSTSIEAYEALLQLSPQRQDWQLRRAELLAWQGNHSEALAAYDNLLAQSPNSLDAKLSRARVLTWTNRPDLSLPEFEHVLAQDPDNTLAQIGKAEALLWKGDLSQAAALYETLLDQDPENRQLRLNLAKTYQGQSKVTDSLRALAPLLNARDLEALRIARELRRPISQTTFEGYWKEEESFQAISEEVQFRINDSDTLQSVTVGSEFYQQDGVEDVRNIPLRFAAEGPVNGVQLKGTVGADIFNDGISAAPYLQLEAKTEIRPNLYLLGSATQERYKDKAHVIRNEIGRLRLEPALYWQIDQETSLYAGYGTGLYSDNNIEHDVLLEAKREFGDFFVSGVGYYQSFSDSSTDDYFAPDRYWFYSGEAGWQGKIRENGQLMLAASLGQQQYSNRTEDIYGFRASWLQQVSDQLELELNYRYSNQPKEASSSSSHEQALQFRVGYRF